MKKTILWLGFELLVLACLNFAMIQWMMDQQPVARLFAMGGHTPLWVPVICGFFLGIRILLYCLLPGIIIYRIGAVGFGLDKQRTGLP